MIHDVPNEAYEVVRSEPGPLRNGEDLPFLITAGDLRDRRAKRRRNYPAAPTSSAGWSS
jgi:hypothetical protein